MGNRGRQDNVPYRWMLRMRSEESSDHMSPRIEPTLEPTPEPAGTPTLRVAPSLRSRPLTPPQPPPRDSLLSWIFGFLLAFVALVLMVVVGLRWLPPPTSSYMLQSPVKPVQYHWVPAASISDNARRAVVAAEDQKFWTHNGFDMDAIHKAEQYNLDHPQRRRGASSISQQTAKNLFLWPGGYVRKGIEAGLTVLIEKIWGKDRILEMYLNIAEFGPGIYGVEAASQIYFGKPAATLTPEEAARLAAVLPNPRHWSVRAPGAYVQTRVAWILGQMGYGSPGAPQQEPEPPASELPDADDAGSARPDAPPAVPPAAAVVPQSAPADTAPAPAPPPSDSPADHGESAPQPPAAAPEPPPPDTAKPPA